MEPAQDLDKGIASLQVAQHIGPVVAQVRRNEIGIPLAAGRLGVERADNFLVGLDRHGSSPLEAAAARCGDVIFSTSRAREWISREIQRDATTYASRTQASS